MSVIETPVIPQYYQDPDADLDYFNDWSVWMAKVPGDTILESTWIVPSGLTSHSESLESGTKAVIWLKGGTLGVNYEITNRIVTSQGRTNDQTIRLFIETF